MGISGLKLDLVFYKRQYFTRNSAFPLSGFLSHIKTLICKLKKLVIFLTLAATGAETHNIGETGQSTYKSCLEIYKNKLRLSIN